MGVIGEVPTQEGCSGKASEQPAVELNWPLGAGAGHAEPGEPGGEYKGRKGRGLRTW